MPILPELNTVQNSTLTQPFQVICAWPLSGQYGPGSRILYYVLVAACVFAQNIKWLRKACVAGALLFPAVAAIHGVVLAALHVDGAVDMDIYGAFQICGIAMLAAPVTVRLSTTYFDDPGRNTIFLWTLFLISGLLGLTVEFYRSNSVTCNIPASEFVFGITTCGLRCSYPDGPQSPMRQDAANNIYVIPAPSKLTFGTGTILSAACCIPSILSIISIWGKVLEMNYRKKFGGKSEIENLDAPIQGTKLTVGGLNRIDNWMGRFLNVVEVPLYVGAVLAVLAIGERNFFSREVKYQTEPIESIGQWAPLAGTGLAILGALHMYLVGDADSEDDLAAQQPRDQQISSIQTDGSIPLRVPGNHERSASDGANLAPTTTASTHDVGNRRKVARFLEVTGDFFSATAHNFNDESGFRKGNRADVPEIPGEEFVNPNVPHIRQRLHDHHSRTSFNDARSSASSRAPSPTSPRSPRSPSPMPPTKPRSSTLPTHQRASFDGPSGMQSLHRPDSLQVPTSTHLR